MRSERRPVLAWLLLSAATLASCEGGAPTELRAPEVVGEVAGIVSVEGVPAEGLRIVLGGTTSRTAVTDLSGRYRFQGLAPGAYLVGLEPVPAELEFETSSAAVVVTAQRPTVRADFAGTRRRDAGVRVSVVAEGTPLAGVLVSLDGPESTSAETDLSGSALFSGLLAGPYEVRLSGYDPALYSFPEAERSVEARHGEVGDASFEGTFRIPAAPGSVAATAAGPSSVDLRWTDESDNEAGFEVERLDGESSTGGAVVGANVTAFTDDGLEPATEYAYRVRACNPVGCSGWGEIASATTEEVPPDPPTALEAEATGSASVGLVWVDGSDNEEGFEVERRTAGEGDWLGIADLGPDVTDFRDGELEPATVYRFRVRACNVAGCSAYSNEAIAETADVPPSAPTGLSAVAVGPGAAEVAWADGSDNETGFEVERRTAPGNWLAVAFPGADVTGFTDGGLAPVTSYAYRVRACNVAGCSAYSNEAGIVTPDVPPATPAGAQAQAVGSGAIDVTWVDASDNETGFEIERSRDAGLWTAVGAPAAGSTSFSDTGLVAETSYGYRIRACNPEGCSSWSDPAFATTWATGPNLTVAAAYVTQRTQRLGGDVPLVSGLGGFVRVFAVADEANTLQPTVQVDFFLSGSLAHTETLSLPAPGVPMSPDESSFATSWNVAVPTWLLQPGLAIRAVVDPGNAIAESNETDNSFPAGGSPLPLDVRDTPPFEVTLIPVRHTVNGTVGDVTVANADEYMADARRLFPLSTDDVAVHAEYSTSAGELQSSDGNGAWGTILGEIQALRVAEGSSRNYYGVVHPTYGGGIAGLGYVGWGAAIGWDKLPSGAGVAAHEWGHNFGRRHSPGCGAGSPDAGYPYPGGGIGVWGHDLSTQTPRAPSTYFDFMSYCDPAWVSDYVYEKILDYRELYASLAPSVAPVGGLLVWGRIENGEAVLEPVFSVAAPPSLPSGGGGYTLTGRGATGEVLFAFSFDPAPVADGADGDGHFAFVVPARALGGRGLSELVLGRGASDLRVLRAASGPAAAPGPPSALFRPASPGALEVRWNADVHPMALVRDAVSGEVLSFARGGAVTVHPRSDRVEVVLSTGLESSEPLVRVWR